MKERRKKVRRKQKKKEAEGLKAGGKQGEKSRNVGNSHSNDKIRF